MNIVGMNTLLMREIFRVLRIWRQSFLPVVITTYLYFVIFGYVLGARIGVTQGVRYGLFIAPGLMMMSVVSNSYINSSFTVFSDKYHHGFVELLSAPLSDHVIILSFALGSVFRGFVTALLVLLVSSLFVDLSYVNYLGLFFVVFSSSFLLSMIGVVNGLMAQNFDDTGFVPSFILTPLTFLGGVFFPTEGLSPFWQGLSEYNPLAIMCRVYRAIIAGTSIDHEWWYYVVIWLISSLFLWGWAWYIMNRSSMVRS